MNESDDESSMPAEISKEPSITESVTKIHIRIPKEPAVSEANDSKKVVSDLSNDES